MMMMMKKESEKKRKKIGKKERKERRKEKRTHCSRDTNTKFSFIIHNRYLLVCVYASLCIIKFVCGILVILFIRFLFGRLFSLYAHQTIRVHTTIPSLFMLDAHISPNACTQTHTNKKKINKKTIEQMVFPGCVRAFGPNQNHMYSNFILFENHYYNRENPHSSIHSLLSFVPSLVPFIYPFIHSYISALN